MSLTLHAAIIEWESSTSPSLFLATSERDAAEQALREVIERGAYVEDDEDFWTDPERPENHVTADALADLSDDELLALNDRFREATTVPWITLDTTEVPMPQATLRLADDELKSDLEVTCDRCDAHLADAEHGDGLDVLVRVAAEHVCPTA